MHPAATQRRWARSTVDADAVGHYFLRLALCQDFASAAWLADEEVAELERRLLCPLCGAQARLAAAEEFVRSEHLAPYWDHCYVRAAGGGGGGGGGPAGGQRWDSFGRPLAAPAAGARAQWERVPPRAWSAAERAAAVAAVVCGAPARAPAKGDPLRDVHVRVPFEQCAQLVKRRDPDVVLS